LKNPHIYEIISTELFVDMKNLQNIVEIPHKTMLKNLTPMNAYV
jgi:hypothetical protein